ncbi:MAG: protein phosphatase 2C domain-containing protein [Pseudanabaena sp. M046S1SP1A06QC]|nr:protein phosphatase 2C domain-containing protein [Pseudanabaena sp. M046S1SP1A06QC]
MAGVADGSGSVSLSEVGSLLAVQTAVKGIASKIAESSIPDSDEGWKVLLNSGLEDALVAIQEEAEARQVNVRELSTTLLIAIATPEIVAAIQVGDGAIVVANQKGTAIALTSPPIEES